MDGDAIPTNHASSVSLEMATVAEMVVELNRRGAAYLLVVEHVGPVPEGQVKSTVYMNGCVHRVSALFRMLCDSIKGKWGLK